MKKHIFKLVWPFKHARCMSGLHLHVSWVFGLLGMNTGILRLLQGWETSCLQGDLNKTDQSNGYKSINQNGYAENSSHPLKRADALCLVDGLAIERNDVSKLSTEKVNPSAPRTRLWQDSRSTASPMISSRSPFKGLRRSANERFPSPFMLLLAYFFHIFSRDVDAAIHRRSFICQ